MEIQYIILNFLCMLQNGEHSHLTNPYILYNRNRGGVVGILTRLRTGQPRNLGSIPGTTRSLLTSKDCRLLLGPIQPPTQRIPWMFSQGYGDRGLRSTTHLNLLPVCFVMSSLTFYFSIYYNLGLKTYHFLQTNTSWRSCNAAFVLSQLNMMTAIPTKAITPLSFIHSCFDVQIQKFTHR
jgi:hypothetical protein